MRRLLVSIASAVLLACSGEGEAGTDSPDDTYRQGIVVPEDPQRPGDPTAGGEALLDRGYISCGIPASIFSLAFPTTDENRVPGRTGAGADLPYNYNAYPSPDGVSLVVQNCYTCHGGHINGALVLGLGNNSFDYTVNPVASADAALSLLQDPAEIAAFQKFIDRIDTLVPYMKTESIGVNPARSITGVLIAHRDRDTLAWSAAPLIDIPNTVLPVDVPPWWRMKKKHAMFYDAAGRGDHTRHMMLASSICTDSVPEAEAIFDYFDDVRAYIASLEPPPYPFTVDQTLADTGRTVFESRCSTCHGTYGDGAEYPNLLIPLDVIGTDPLIVGSTGYTDELVAWLNESVYGVESPYVPGPGYIAPPLDGIWATAPFLHNGSVPTIEAVLDSSKRPTYWTRTFDSTDYDQDALGFHYTELPSGHDAVTDPAQKAKIYDTTITGYGNAGHDFGDALTADERRAVIEYLKTL